MSNKLYVDTNIIIDAVENRKNLFGKNIGNPAIDLFYVALQCKYYLMISDWTLEELSHLRKISSFKSFFGVLKKKIVRVTYSVSDVNDAKIRSKENTDDALHIIIAEKEGADLIVTRNIKHFRQIGTKIPIKVPEDLV